MPPRTRSTTVRPNNKQHRETGKEEETTNNMGKEKQKRKHAIDASLSINQSESSKCPRATGKHLNSNSTMIPRRGTLRSSKRLAETGKTSFSRCPQPLISREHSSAIQQTDDPVDTAIQVQAGSVVEEAHEAEDTLEKEVPLEKDTHWSPYPCSSGNLNLTEIVKMWDDEDDEVNSVGQSSSMDTVLGYRVKPSSMLMLRKILNKHVDIAENCTLLTMRCRSKLLEMICDIVSELQEKEFRKIKDVDLDNMIAIVDDIKIMNVDIEWLQLRLVEILEARQILPQSGRLKAEKDTNRKVIGAAERELAEFEVQKKEVEAKFQSICGKETLCKETLAIAKEESIKIEETIKLAKSKVRRFHNCSLVDDLL